MRRTVSLTLLALLLLCTLSLTFNVRLVHAQAETVYINSDGSITPSSAPISTVDNSTYALNGNVGELVVERDNIVIDGASYAIGGLTSNALVLVATDNVTVENTQIWTRGTFFGGEYVAQPGVQMTYCTNIRLLDNNLTVNVFCVRIDYSNDTIISGNNIFINKTSVPAFNTSQWAGIEMEYSSGNVISDNNITGCGIGVYLNSCSGNSIYQNNFINNTEQVNSNNSTNTWDDGYPSGGNYWSDYNGTDQYSGPYQNLTGSDGIGDTPYVINANNTDHYPLMGPFSDFSVGAGVDVQVVSNSTVSDFQFNGTAILFNVSGANGTTGFCNVRVPTSLLNGTLTVFVNGTQVQYSLLPSANGSVSYLYFIYGHSTEQVTILPEFPDSLILAMFMFATLLTIAIYKKKHTALNRALFVCFVCQ